MSGHIFNPHIVLVSLSVYYQKVAISKIQTLITFTFHHSVVICYRLSFKGVFLSINFVSFTIARTSDDARVQHRTSYFLLDFLAMIKICQKIHYLLSDSSFGIKKIIQQQLRNIIKQMFEKSHEQRYSAQILSDINSKQVIINSFRRIEASILFLFMLSSFFSIEKCIDFSKNYIQNEKFSQPIVNYNYQDYNYSIPGWQCTWVCQIKNCAKGRAFQLRLNQLDSCNVQAIDLNSNSFNKNVTQLIDLTAANYQLHFNYYQPIYGSRTKKLKLAFNNKTILYEQPLVDSSISTFQFYTEIQSIEGTKSLVFSNLGYSKDGVGFKINNVSLYKINDETLEYILKIFSEDSSQLNSLPCGRVIFRNSQGFLMNFDRLQLYIPQSRIQPSQPASFTFYQ